MKICPVCSQEFPPGITHCPDDGVVLVSMNTAATGRPEELVGQIVEGRYRIERIVGRGGMGTVYACRHVVVGKIAAMKVLRPGADSSEGVLQRFIREAQTTNLLKSRHIVEIADFGQLPNGLLFVVMELLEGEDLTKAMKPGKITRPELIHVFVQVAETLALAHDKGIVHRDLKPDNVFLVQEGDDRRFVKLLDFGIAKVIHGESNAGLTETGVILGTPYYMSPEQARADLIDHRSDIYSLGVMMYRAFTGRLPFIADSTMGVLTRHITESPVLPSRISNVDPLTERMILRCMEKNPANRFQGMREVVETLRSLPLEAGAAVRDEATVHDRPAPAAPAHTGGYGAVAPFPTAASGVHAPASSPSGAYAPVAMGSGPYTPPPGYAAPAASGPYSPVSTPSGGFRASASPSGPYPLAPAAKDDVRRSGHGMPSPAIYDARSSAPPGVVAVPGVDAAAFQAMHRSTNPSGGHPAVEHPMLSESSMTSLRWPPGTTARGFAATHKPPPQGRSTIVIAVGAALLVVAGALAAFFVFYRGTRGPSAAATASEPASSAAPVLTTAVEPVPSAAPVVSATAAPSASALAAAVPSTTPSADPKVEATAPTIAKPRPTFTGVVSVKPPPSSTGPRKTQTEIRSPFD